jgi:hypothetical protein
VVWDTKPVKPHQGDASNPGTNTLR